MRICPVQLKCSEKGQKLVKLVIQIPCYNEEEALPQTLAELPRHLPGIDAIEWLIIDDGSADRTVDVAVTCGADYVVRHNRNKGLATAFQTGLNACLQIGADIIVNTDADNQYPARYIPALIQPILVGKADMVVGNRQVEQIDRFSPQKKFLQKFGSWVVRYISHTDVPDAPSGFRALSREAALRMNVLTGYTYTLETIIQASKKSLTVSHVPITTNPKTRESRLIRSSRQYVIRSAVTILRLFLLYEPLRTFFYLSIPFLLVGLGLWLRFFVLMLMSETARGSNVQSIIVGSVAILIAFVVFVIGLLGDVVAINRRLQEEILYFMKKNAFSASSTSAAIYQRTDTGLRELQPSEVAHLRSD